MNHSENIADLAASLAKAQPIVKTALMDSTNPFFKSKYADLGAVWDAVRDALKTYNLAVAQFPDNIAGAPALTTMLIHASGQWISGTYPLMVTDKDHTPQGYGSALTYARRYGLSAVMGVIADTDDDGNAASRPPSPAITPQVWAQTAIDRVNGFNNLKDLDAFEKKFTAKIVQIAPLVPDLHSKLVTTLADRRFVLEGK